MVEDDIGLPVEPRRRRAEKEWNKETEAEVVEWEILEVIKKGAEKAKLGEELRKCRRTLKFSCDRVKYTKTEIGLFAKIILKFDVL